MKFKSVILILAMLALGACAYWYFGPKKGLSSFMLVSVKR